MIRINSIIKNEQNLFPETVQTARKTAYKINVLRIENETKAYEKKIFGYFAPMELLLRCLGEITDRESQ